MDKGKSTHDGHRDRMRERILGAGIEKLQPHEVLEYLLFSVVPRKNTNDIAHALIERFGSLSEVLNADYDRLLEVTGMTKNAALFLCSLPDVFRYYSVDSAKERVSLGGRGAARNYLRAKLYGQPVEMVYMAAVDAHDNLLRVEKLSSGSGDKVDISIRNIVNFALSTKASGILIAHNHPSREVLPSQDDINLTREIYWTLDGIGVRLQDHYIFGGGEYFSFEEKHLIDAMRNEKTTTLKDGIIFYE